MNLDEIKPGAPLVEYKGIQILYLEEPNKWRFELRGRERKAESLKQAKEWIDKPEPVKKSTKSFERFQCYLKDRFFSYGDGKIKVQVVTVTSVAEDDYRRGNLPQVAWITSEKSERSKQNVENLLVIDDDTKKKITEYNAVMETIERLKKEAERVLKSIKRVSLEKYVDNGDE